MKTETALIAGVAVAAVGVLLFANRAKAAPPPVIHVNVPKAPEPKPIIQSPAPVKDKGAVFRDVLGFLSQGGLSKITDAFRRPI